MARPRSIEDEELMGRLARVFDAAGYEGASLARLAEASGLKKASLYHRFPNGKAQMAEEVLATVQGWIEANVVAVLAGEGTLRARLERVAEAFDGLYDGGSRACLLNMLATFPGRSGPHEDLVKTCFETLLRAFAEVARAAGAEAPEARAARAVMLVQGSLVLARGLGDTAPFRAALASLADDLGVGP